MSLAIAAAAGFQVLLVALGVLGPYGLEKLDESNSSVSIVGGWNE